VDILVNCAGVADDCLFVKSSAEVMHVRAHHHNHHPSIPAHFSTLLQSVIATNLLGAMYLSKAVLRPMMKQRYGTMRTLCLP
jgi:NAD(P)-dependent dehydrogenase (short-subunit alcohol dehydrogenase family)